MTNIIQDIRTSTKKYPPTLVNTIIEEFGKDPFLVLISCLLSLRSKDSVTIDVCRELFKMAQTPQAILSISTKKLETILFKIGFYRNKAKTIKHVCQVLIDKFNGKVPKTLDELLHIKGIGRKTANLVLGVAYGIPSICVDIHVHRISNRLGFIKTKTTLETEFALQKLLHKKHWIEWNKLLVTWGQNICTPISPWCSKCAIKNHCKQVGVTKSR